MAAVLSSRDVFVVRRAGEGKSVALTGVLSVRTETAQGVRQPSVSIVFGPLLGLAREQVDRLNASIDGTQLVVTSSGREHPVALAVVVCVQLTVDAVRMLRGLQMVIGRPCIVLSGPTVNCMIPPVSLGGLRSHFVPPSASTTGSNQGPPEMGPCTLVRARLARCPAIYILWVNFTGHLAPSLPDILGRGW